MTQADDAPPKGNRSIGNLRMVWGYASKYPHIITGAIIALVAGIGGSALQLAAFWRPKKPAEA